jgi:hypothetical protein
MKSAIFVLLSILLLGCFPVQMWSYEPIDESGRVEQNHKGLTSVSYIKMLDTSSGISISAGSNNKNEFKIYFQISVAKNSKIEITEWNFRLSSESFNKDLIIPIETMSTSVYGDDESAGYRKHVKAGEAFFGEASNQKFDQSLVDLYTVALAVNSPMPENLSISLPAFTVNQEVIEIQPVLFKLSSQYNYGYSMQ